MEIIKHKLNLAETEIMAQQIKRTKQNFFENANKPGRWLAYRLKKEKEKRMINKLQDSTGELQFHNDAMKKIIKDYYEILYKAEEVPKEKIQSYLKKADLPKIPENIRNILNGKISMMEIIEAIKRQKKDKTLGPDGLPAEFYIALQDVLSLTLKELCNEILSETKIPKSWTEANITLIPKEDTDLTQIKNYRTISLLNVDYKIFALIMAERIKKFLTEFD